MNYENLTKNELILEINRLRRKVIVLESELLDLRRENNNEQCCEECKYTGECPECIKG